MDINIEVTTKLINEPKMFSGVPKQNILLAVSQPPRQSLCDKPDVQTVPGVLWSVDLEESCKNGEKPISYFLSFLD